MRLFGKGADRGGSSASMDLSAAVEPGDAPQTSVLAGEAAVVVNGRFAQFGGRLMGQVSDMLLAQFAENFRAAAAALPASGAEGGAADAASAATGASPAASTMDAGGAATTADGSTSMPAAGDATAAAGSSRPARSAPSASPSVATPAASSPSVSSPGVSSPAASPPRAQEIDAFAIAWALVKRWFAQLFGRRPV
jgi:hypothetical protein